MKKTLSLSLICGLTAISLNVSADNNIKVKGDYLTGDPRTACEVILCLSSSKGWSIPECQPPLRKYFSIRSRKWHKTLAKRRKFLELCPASDENETMTALTTVIQNQEYACNASTLNSRTERKVVGISRKDSKVYYRTQTYLPNFCSRLFRHVFTDYAEITRPKYQCDKAWYSETDWRNGYTLKRTSYNYRRDQWNYEKVKIKKDCWK